MVTAFTLAAFASGAQARGVSLESYEFSGANGANPSAGLLPTSSATAIGTARAGGGTGCGGGGCGVVYEISTTGQETLLYAFQGGSDGSTPASDLFADTEGDVYGTTEFGGGTGCGGSGCGTIFVVTSTGQEEIVPFAGGKDGAFPVAGMTVTSKSQNAYGTTWSGGGNGCGGSGCGTVFQVTEEGVESVVYAFKGGHDGSDPVAQLIADKKGNLYGTTELGGGSGCGGNGCGTVFEITPSGAEKLLYAFKGGSDGAEPVGRLSFETNGSLLGTTSTGGAHGLGAVFALDTKQKEHVLYSFAGGNDGANPFAGLLLSTGKGTLAFGTTASGGGSGCGGTGCGTIYEVDQNGKEKVLYAFTDSGDGADPVSDLVGSGKGGKAGKHGYLYGTAFQGGTGCSDSGCGTVFTLKY